MDICERCEDMGCVNCIHCTWGNPCLGCLDYDEQANQCKSNGGCSEEGREKRTWGGNQRHSRKENRQ